MGFRTLPPRNRVLLVYECDCSGNGLDWTKEHKLKSEKNEITAPRIAMYVGFGEENIDNDILVQGTQEQN